MNPPLSNGQLRSQNTGSWAHTVADLSMMALPCRTEFFSWDLSTSPGGFVYLDFNANLWILRSHFPFFYTLRPLTYYVRQLLPLKWIFCCRQVSTALSTPWCPPFSFQSSARCGCTCLNTTWRHVSSVFPPPPGRLFSPNVNQWIQIGTLKNKGLPLWLRW